MTDFVWWNDTRSLSADWAERARFVARFLPPGLAIIDIGCGAMDIERAARPARYIPVDLAARDARTRVLDLNATGIPEEWLAESDVVTMLGVVEYLADPASHLRTIAASGKPLLFTYSAVDRLPDVDRRANGWINDFSSAQLEALLEASGFAIASRTLYAGSQFVWLATPRGAAPAWIDGSVTTSQAARRPTLVLAGFFGRGNCGDEALLQCVFETFESTHDIVISVDEHGAYPGFWDWYPYNRARIIHQTNLAEFSTNPAVAGLLVCGGGLPAGFAANQAIAVRAEGCKSALAAVDLWTTPGASEPQDVEAYTDLFDVVALRHKAQTGGGPENVRARRLHGADWALLLPQDQQPDIENDPKRAIVTLREFPIHSVPYAYASEIAALFQHVRDHGFKPVLLPFAPEDERFLAEMALDRLAPIERCWWNPRRARQWIGASGLVLSVGRLHPLIFAASAGTPCASITPPRRSAAGERIAPKLSLMTEELGIATIADIAELPRFLAAPRPADGGLVKAAERRLDDMIGELRSLFAATRS